MCSRAAALTAVTARNGLGFFFFATAFTSSAWKSLRTAAPANSRIAYVPTYAL